MVGAGTGAVVGAGTGAVVGAGTGAVVGAGTGAVVGATKNGAGVGDDTGGNVGNPVGNPVQVSSSKLLGVYVKLQSSTKVGGTLLMMGAEQPPRGRPPTLKLISSFTMC